MGRLENKIAIVTGAGSGIGRAITLRFAAEGARVIAADITDKEKEVAAEAQGEVLPFRCDVANPEQVQALMEFCRKRFGRLDVLCNNAGIGGRSALLHETSLEDWDRVMNVNVRGAFLVLKYAIPLMIDSGGGSIVNMASLGSFRASPRVGAYFTSKGALKLLTQAAALEYVDAHIRVNAICPGTVETPLLALAPADMREMMLKRVPQARFGTPEEVASLALFLASDEATYITGASYVIDGGRSAG
jgi:NAD(P)-dependent dehydrogenase (short-subunit alcohol dehydrogenase family)